MKKFAASMLAVYAAGAAPGHAADVVAVPSPQPFVYQEVYVDEEPQWDGPFAGLRGGYGWSRARGTLSGYGSSSENFDGAIASAFAGYNKQLGNVVLGVEADAGYNWANKSYPTGLGFNVEEGTDWNGSLRGRVGYSFGNLLAYLTAGAAVANYYGKALNVDVSDALYGYTVGAGVDYAITDNIFARLEYRYTGYPDQKVLEDIARLAGTDAKLNMHTHAVTAGVGVKF
ncbi:outer membrane protein [Martelella endophytica]|uniref:Outer membrane protein beta-barrel domain-containing protein n=1 Tax=Martelella endophytica TaxID=1486262 RepID=A0A0D5LQQ4_MAREN|nr:outer membrane protein [Martelella endophytica]AJY46549.1 hypothetical protein TM49_14105 [Martelella endophytica]